MKAELQLDTQALVEQIMQAVLQALEERLPRSPEPEALLTVQDLARYLQVSRSWIYAQVAAGAIPHIRLPCGVRFRRSDIDSWLAQCDIMPGQGTTARSRQRRRQYGQA